MRKRAELRKLGNVSNVECADESFARGRSASSADDDGGFPRGVTGGSTTDDGGFARGVSGTTEDDSFTRGVTEGSATDNGGFFRGVVTGSTIDEGGFARGVSSATEDDGFARGVTGGSATDGGLTEGEEDSKRKLKNARRHSRPTKTQRELYRKFIEDVEQQLRRDPAAFDVERFTVPEAMTHMDSAHEMLTVKARFRLKRLQAELLGQPLQPNDPLHR